MVNIEVEKNKLRKKYIQIRNNIKNKKVKSNIITNRVIENEAYKKAKTIALYRSFSSEVDTTKLIEYSIANGKIVCLPKVMDNDLKFYEIGSLSEKFIKSKFGVEEPIGYEFNYIDKRDVDLVIVPGVCFDKEKNRLGFGKGYYDRFLGNTQLNTIAICFSKQILDNGLLPITNNDVRVGQIITDEKIY